MEGMQLDNKYFTKPYNPPVPSKVCLHNQKRRDFFIPIATSLCKVWFCECRFYFQQIYVVLVVETYLSNCGILKVHVFFNFKNADDVLDVQVKLLFL